MKNYIRVLLAGVLAFFGVSAFAVPPDFSVL